jgi:hypothetical protein
MGRFLSGQRDRTVNATRKLRWFKSTSPHQYYNEKVIMKDVITKRQIKELTVGKISEIQSIGELQRIETKIRSILSDIINDNCHGTKLFAQDPETLVQMTLFGTEKVLHKDCDSCKRTLPLKVFFCTFKGNRKNARGVCTECHKAFNGNAMRFLVAIKQRLDVITNDPLGPFIDNN